MKKSVIIIFVFLSITSFAQNNYKSWMNGTWTGIGIQPNIAGTWQIDLSFPDSKGELLVNYPSLQCDGEWIFESQTKNRAVFKEKIIEGKDRCIDGSIIIVTRINKNYINIAWFSDYIKGIDAYSVLQKK